MTTTINHGVKLSNYQKKIITKGNFPINIRLNNKSLIGPDNLLLTKRQFNKIQKSLNNGTGTDLKLKKNQILYNDEIRYVRNLVIHKNRIQEQQGGFLGALANLGRIILPFVSKLAPKILKPLASGAVNALGSLGIEKLISGKGLLQNLQQKYNFSNKNNFRKEEIINDIQKVIKFLEENKNFKVNKKQQGGFLGALAAAIGIPLIAKLFGAGSIQEGQGILSNFLKMIGLGMDFDSNRTSQNLIDFFPPHTTSNIKGPNIRSGGKGLSLNKEYQDLGDFFLSHTYSNVKLSKGKAKKKKMLNFFKDFRILSNIDLLIISENLLNLDLGIINKKYDGVFSRDNIPNKNGMYIINLDSKIGLGTHWVSVIIKSKKLFYFDSFGLIPPYELINLRSEYYYNFLQYQPINSFLCGYYCLYFLNEFDKLSKKNDYSSIEKFNKIIEPFHINDFEYNDNFIKKYFINIYNNGKI